MPAANPAIALDENDVDSGGLARSAVIGTVVLLGISYMFNSMDRQVFPALLSAVMPEYGLTLPQAGFVSTVFTVTVAIFGALSGWFMSRFGRKSVLVGGLVAYSAFTFLTPFASGFVSLATFRTLSGAGEALQVGAVFACLGGYFGHRRGTYMGVFQAFFGLGAVLGPVLGTRLFAWSGSWQLPFYLFGIIGIMVAAAVAFTVPRSFTDAAEPGPTRAALPTEIAPGSRNVALATAAFLLLGTEFFAYTSLYATYLHSELGFSISDAGMAFGMYGVGATGAIVGGWLGERLGRTGVLSGLLVLAATGYALFHVPASILVQGALSFVFGLMISGFMFARLMSVAQLSARPERIGAVVALVLAAYYGPGPFAGYLFGKLVVLFGWGNASVLLLVVPAVLAAILMTGFDYRRLRRA